MSAHRSIRIVVLAAFTAGAAAAPAATPAKATPAELDALVKALPPTGAHDRTFLALAPALAARLAIDPVALKTADPGVACDVAAKSPVMYSTKLGRAGQVETLCMPGGRSLGMLTLADGSSFSTNCGGTGSHVQASADLTVGDQSMHVSTEPPPGPRVPTQACTGWLKLPH